MSNLVEINRLFVRVDRELLGKYEEDLFPVSGNLPVLNIPFRGGVVGMDWDFTGDQGNSLTSTIRIVGEVVDPDWSVISRINLMAQVRRLSEIVRWGSTDEYELESLRAGDDSVIFVDDRKVNLITTVNTVLDFHKSSILGKTFGLLERELRNISLESFNSNLLLELLEEIYYRWVVRNVNSKDEFELTASVKREHFSQSGEAVPYLYLNVSTEDLLWYLNRTVQPTMEIQNYKLSFVSLSVIGDNMFIINIKELTNNWLITLDVLFELQNNVLQPIVRNIQAEGLGVFGKVVFSLFKKVLIGQIEKRPVPVRVLYQKLKSRFENRYPFIEILPDHEVEMDSLTITPEQTEMMVHFVNGLYRGLAGGSGKCGWLQYW